MPIQPHPILLQSFALIDQEIGAHAFSAEEYAIVRRVIHSTADFEFQHLLQFHHGVIARVIPALQQGCAIITDVSMVRQGIATMVAQTFANPVICAVEQVPTATAEQTRTELGLIQCFRTYPQGLYVIGNAPTALQALCRLLQEQAPDSPRPVGIIGVPVGFVGVIEAKAALQQLAVPQILSAGRKGGSPVAAAIVNALLTLAADPANPVTQKD
jgi:precorrin-8X/cobalt-precorrin-8 methylmutase